MVQTDITFPADKPLSNRIEWLVEAVCARHGLEDADISVAVVDDETISGVHKEFMNDPTTTDVISFDLTDEGDSAPTFEMVVNADMAQRMAEEMGHSTEEELLLYVLHGLLHNLGFDDLTEEDFLVMHKEEDDILEELGLGRLFGERKFVPKNLPAN
ncbi:MAG: rRNA maturation RNase YbeY [Phycisphaerae bacterium]|jgi:probable rRNA maturation factor